MFSIPPQITLTNANVKNPSQNYITNSTPSQKRVKLQERYFKTLALKDNLKKPQNRRIVP